MDNFIEDYKRVDKEVRQRISSDMIKVIGLDNLLYAIIHALICKCIDNNIPREERRQYVMDIIDAEINKWI